MEGNPHYTPDISDYYYHDDNMFLSPQSWLKVNESLRKPASLLYRNRGYIHPIVGLAALTTGAYNTYNTYKAEQAKQKKSEEKQKAKEEKRQMLLLNQGLEQERNQLMKRQLMLGGPISADPSQQSIPPPIIQETLEPQSGQEINITHDPTGFDYPVTRTRKTPKGDEIDIPYFSQKIKPPLTEIYFRNSPEILKESKKIAKAINKYGMKYVINNIDQFPPATDTNTQMDALAMLTKRGMKSLTKSAIIIPPAYRQFMAPGMRTKLESYYPVGSGLAQLYARKKNIISSIHI